MLNKKQTYQLEFIKNNPIVRNAGPWNDDIYVHNLEFALKKLKIRRWPTPHWLLLTNNVSSKASKYPILSFNL